jgi:glycine/D-amino acid oxidase-like deaminating enzyme
MSRPWPEEHPKPWHRAAYADARVEPFWLDDLPPRQPHPPLTGVSDADLCIVGGGYTGLWAALHAKRLAPDTDVVLLEASACGAGASGRNGGIALASLTHGLENGLARFADEMETLERLGLENFDGLKADLRHYEVDAELDVGGDLTVALEPHELEEFAGAAELMRRYGHDVSVLGADEVRAELDSPTYLGGLLDHTGAAIVHPGKLADGLRAAAVRAGVRVHEGTHVNELRGEGAGVRVSAAGGSVHAERVLVATSAYPSPVRALRRYIAPVYDYALMSEPLSAEQQRSLGWARPFSVGDAANQFHYYRQTRDGRILWGGYDAVYRFGGPVAHRYDDHEATFARLAQHFFTTFPQLEGLRFTHRWGAAIDTCSRFSVFFGRSFGGRVVYAAGYTGLGVCATRFGARVALELSCGRESQLTRLRYVRTRPLPFPPEPLRYGVIALTRNRLAAADRRQGRRGLWLRTLDRLGLGFDS